MVKMKKIAIILIVIIALASCHMNPPPPDIEYSVVRSDSIFAINGKAYTIYYTTRDIITLYNPNNYEITITVGSESMKINPLSSITIQTLTQSDREVEA